MSTADSVNAVLGVLRGRRGADQAISAPGICELLEWSPVREREVRGIIEWHALDVWDEHGLLCAIPGKGYFFATAIEEVAAYREYLLGLQDAAWDKRERFDKAAKKAGFNLKGVGA